MKQKLTLGFFFLLCLNLFSQAKFEKGYFITNENVRTECLIKNLDLVSNPTKFYYKKETTSSTQTHTIDHIKEFGIYTVSKYIRATVDIEKSSQNIAKATHSRKPKFEKNQTLFLKVIVEGKASLYSYEEKDFLKFFFKTDKKKKIEQLIFINYYVDSNKIKQNNYFQQQLINDLKCGLIYDKVKNITYTDKNLSKIFISVNTCLNSKYRLYKNLKKGKKIPINFSLKAGLSYSSLSFSDPRVGDPVKYPQKSGFEIGFETEIVIPYYNKQFSLIVQPTYRNYTSSENITKASSSRILQSKIKLNRIEFPTGLRYSYYINKKSRFYTSLFYNLNFLGSQTIEIDGRPDFDFKLSTNPGLSFGYNHNSKYIIEFVLFKTQNSTGGEVVSNNSSFIIGYQF